VDEDMLQALISNGESQTLEFKVAPPRLAELAQRLCGFANSVLGGTLIIGIEDKTLQITGVKSVADTTDAILQAARHCKPIVPLIPPHPQLLDLNGKKLVIAHIPPNRGELYQATNTFWIRRGTNTIGMEKREILEFVYRQGLASWETQPASLASLEDLDLERVQLFVDQRPERSRRGGRLDDLTQILLTLRCAVRTETDGLIRPTNAGLLLFGYAPQNFFTQSEIIITAYQDNLGVRRYADRKIVGGTLTEQIDEAERYLRLTIPMAARMEGFHRIDEPELPLEALREAIVNAVVHRDYSIEGTAVRLFLYPDRVEVYSPGLLLPGISLEELRRGQVTSKPRNPVIASVLRDLPGGYMERMGSGIRYMIEQMQAFDLPHPEFREQSEFIVTFWRPSRAGAVGAKPPSQTTTTGSHAPFPTTPPTELTQSTRLELALRYVHEHGAITNKQYRELTGVAETTAMRDLEMLVERGALRAIGKRRGRHYVL
jgi:ATP-dependent DNA helicase RecG